MKAIVIEVKNGPTEFLMFDTDRIYMVFRKLCHNSNMLYVDSELGFEDLKDLYIPLGVHKIYQGPGIYDHDGNKYPVLKDAIGTVYYIVECFTQTTTNTELITNLKELIPAKFFL